MAHVAHRLSLESSVSVYCNIGCKTLWVRALVTVAYFTENYLKKKCSCF